MGRIVRLTERDLTRLVKRVIKEDQERFELSDVKAGACGNSGTWEVKNGSLILLDCDMNGLTIDVAVV
jgi:hypothetical protein